MSTNLLDLTYRDQPLGATLDDFGLLRPSADSVGDREELQRRMDVDGYLYLPGLLDTEDVLAGRREIMGRLADAGLLDSNHPPEEGVAAPPGQRGRGVGMRPITVDNPPLSRVLHQGPMMDFYRFFLGGPVRHFDYTWFRVKTPGATDPTTPHCDIVYMGRGTRRLYTSWTPFGDVPLEMGGLMVLENSHKLEELRSTYGSTDVDLYCENRNDALAIVQQAQTAGRELTREEGQLIEWNSTGAYSGDALAARAELGGRWLTADYKMGDLLIFCMDMMHASSDNRSDRVRISSDSRYQLAAEAVDERWIGDDPPAHGIRAKKGMVC
ncbi:MAG: phytanoyl-CoA dioxygenase [Candidatus Latescibacteria bacterium]|nr:phytanoyl-CoA dioxygenase [Candidatus Latescibacterota bacterium]